MFVIILRIILVLAPVVALFFWLRWRANKLKDGVDLDHEISKLRRRILVLLLLVVLAVIGIKLMETEKGDAGDIYTPAHMEDGKLVPGTFKKPKKTENPNNDG